MNDDYNFVKVSVLSVKLRIPIYVLLKKSLRKYVMALITSYHG